MMVWRVVKNLSNNVNRYLGREAQYRSADGSGNVRSTAARQLLNILANLIRTFFGPN